MKRIALIFLLAAVGCGGAVAPTSSSIDARDTSRPHEFVRAQAPEMRCAIADGRTVTCSGAGDGLPSDVLEIIDINGNRCGTAITPYAGSCTTGTTCWALMVTGADPGPRLMPVASIGICE